MMTDCDTLNKHKSKRPQRFRGREGRQGCSSWKRASQSMTAGRGWPMPCAAPTQGWVCAGLQGRCSSRESQRPGRSQIPESRRASAVTWQPRAPTTSDHRNGASGNHRPPEVIPKTGEMRLRLEGESERR